MTRPCFALVLIVLASPPVRAAAPAPATKPVPRFEQHIRPILKAHCFECHGEATKLKGGLDVRLRRSLVAGGESGAALLLGDPADSILYQRIASHQMPPGKVKLSAAEVALVREWIAAGAPTARPEPARLAPGIHINDDDRTFWSFQPIRLPAVPRVRRPERVRTPVDAFLLAKLDDIGLTLSSDADRHTFIRRATFDLLGLPPTPEEVAAFVADARPDATARLVDRLLASPAYGERWGRHWLDVAGYADSHGYTGIDPVRKYSWKYRDWVIRAFNGHMPFDRFVTEQLAGDELVRSPSNALTDEDRDRLIATGFLRTAPDGTASGAGPKEAGNQLVADTVQIVSTSLMGLTMHCAQCHNHRYDPIPQADYYRLRAVFEPAYDVSTWRVPQGRLVSLLTPEGRAAGVKIEQAAVKVDQRRSLKLRGYIEATFRKQLAKVPEAVRPEVVGAYRTPVAKRTPAQNKRLLEFPSVNVSDGSLYLYDSKAVADLTALAKEAAALRATKPVEDFIDVLNEVPGKVPATRLFNRGDPEQPREAVLPGGLTILTGLDLGAIPSKDAALPTTGRRLAFAKQLTSGKHPLFARAIVNRVWMHHFGKGIVETPGDLGMLGARPTHPELLDYLAGEFMRDWSLPRLHRLIMNSAAYAQASGRHADGQRLDPENKLLWRMHIRRLEGEAIRDSILSVTGRLERRPFGEPVPVKPDLSGQIILGVDRRDGAGYLTIADRDLGNDIYRRSVYVQARRSMVLGVLETFDSPTVSPNCEKRTFSTVAPQALLLMNSPFMTDSASAFADRLMREAGDDRARVRLGWRLVYGRDASAGEGAEALAFLGEQAAYHRARKLPTKAIPPEKQALMAWCQALLSSNPFLYVD
jgi:mono/diheme cytochrome c family protein